MERNIFITDDGSTSIHLPELEEQYHSKHGAIQEAYHVFIRHGLDLFKDKSNVSILEIGFGTGLNCFISYLEGLRRALNIHYVGIEAYPVTLKESVQLNYVKELKAKKHQAIFDELHQSFWEEEYTISKQFILTKHKQFFNEITAVNQHDIIYFDAFGAKVQPELWTETIFKIMFTALKTNGILVTYSAKGSVRRAMQTVGFTVERLPGPKGKREMLRGIKQE